MMSPVVAFHRHRQAGISIIELMVGVVIGLVSVLVLMQVGITFEDQKRTTVGGGDALDASSVALNLMQRSISMAGFGLNDKDTIGCSLLAYRESSGTAITGTLLPADIVQGADGAPDTLTLRAGNTNRFAETGLFSLHTGNDAAFVTDSNYGFSVGDVFLVVEGGITNCTLAEVSGIPPGSPTDIQHAAGSTRYNQPDGSGVAYGSNARLINLGRNPTLTQFSVVDGRLRMTDLLSGDSFDILESVITFQAQYGFNASVGGLTWSDTIIDADGDGTVGDDDDWLRLRAIRVALLIRHGKMEKPNSEGDCDATPATVSWSFGSFNVSALTDGRCFRYRAVESTVPMRNVIWSPGT